MQGGAVYGYMRNLVKVSTLVVPIVSQFSHSNSWNKTFTLATCKFKRMNVIARLTIETWSMNLADVDELAKDFIGVKYLLNCQDLFDKTVDTEGMETKVSTETVRVVQTMHTRKVPFKKLCRQRNTIYWIV